MFNFNENKVMKINAPADDNLLLFFNLFATDQLLSELVTNSNSYAQKVTSSSQPLRIKIVLNTWKDVTVTVMKQFLEFVLHKGLFSC